MRKAIILGSILTLGTSLPAMTANEFSYTYAEVGYINGESSGRDGDGARHRHEEVAGHLGPRMILKKGRPALIPS